MIYNYNSIHEFLQDELRRRVQSNPRYSLRSFARNLRLSPGALSEILKGRRDLSLKAVNNVAKAIGLNTEECKHLLQLAHQAKVKKSEFPALTATREQHIIDQDLFSLISEPHHFAILNLLDCEKFEWKANWIAPHLGITLLQAQMAMDLLIRLGLVAKRNGRYVGKSEHLASSHEIPSAAIRHYHRQILEKAIAALDTQEISERDISGSGFAVDPTHLPALKKEIHEFQERLLAKYGSGKKTEVYFLEMALFKLTQGSKK